MIFLRGQASFAENTHPSKCPRNRPKRTAAAKKRRACLPWKVFVCHMRTRDVYIFVYDYAVFRVFIPIGAFGQLHTARNPVISGKNQNDKTPFLCIREKNIEMGIYFSFLLLYDKREQSRILRVKCCQNGELSGRRRMFSAMKFPHPLPIKGSSPFMRGDTQYGGSRLNLPFPRVF